MHLLPLSGFLGSVLRTTGLSLVASSGVLVFPPRCLPGTYSLTCREMSPYVYSVLLQRFSTKFEWNRGSEMRRSSALARSQGASFLRASPNSLISASKSPFRVDRMKFHLFAYSAMCSSMVVFRSSNIRRVILDRTALKSVTVFPSNFAASSS